MPIFNNPAIGQAFSNIAGMFAPPSGSDAAGYAVAAAKKAEAARIAALYEGAAGDPDRQAAIAGAYLPTQSYRALEMGDATTRRGQDLESGDRRYGVDVGATTSRANNAATVAGSTQNQRIQGLASLYQPLNPGQVRPELPAEIAGQFGAPGAIGAAAGAAKPFSETEMVGTILGRQDEATQDRLIADKFAPSETQVAGQDRRRLVDSGAIGDRDLVDLVMGERSPVEAIGPGGSPVFMSPGAAVRTGAAPYNKPDAQNKPTNGVARLPNGMQVPARQNADGQWVHAQTNEPLPDDIQVFNMPSPQGTNEQIGLGKPTEFTARNGIFSARAIPANKVMNDLTAKGYVPAATDYELLLGGTGDKLPLSATNMMVSTEGRQFYNSAMNFMMSVLRPDTGAAFGKEEFSNYARVFIPIPGDDPGTLKNKAEARATALAALTGSSAGATQEITRVMQANGVPIPPEMQRYLDNPQPIAPSGAAASVTARAAGGDPLSAARAAIARGANREAVAQRLRDNGIDPGGL